MWMRRALFESLIEGRAAALAREAAAQAEVARLKASCDWLAAHVTELSSERAALFQRVLDVQIPAIQIAQQADAEATRDRIVERPKDLTPEKLRQMAAQYAPPPGAPGVVYKPTAEMEAESAMAIFEDIGDEAAQRLGLQ